MTTKNWTMAPLSGVRMVSMFDGGMTVEFEMGKEREMLVFFADWLNDRRVQTAKEEQINAAQIKEAEIKAQTERVLMQQRVAAEKANRNKQIEDEIKKKFIEEKAKLTENEKLIAASIEAEEIARKDVAARLEAAKAEAETVNHSQEHQEHDTVS